MPTIRSDVLCNINVNIVYFWETPAPVEPRLCAVCWVEDEEEAPVAGRSDREVIRASVRAGTFVLVRDQNHLLDNQTVFYQQGLSAY